MPSPFDFHTHNAATQPGCGIVCLGRELLQSPRLFRPVPGALYSAGIHPWWTAEEWRLLLPGLENLLQHPQVVALGECGFDALRGAPLEEQAEAFELQIALAECYRLPVTLHCVRAHHLLLSAHKRLHPTTLWTLHGFRGNAALARQLLDAGFDLSFGPYFNAEALRLTPPERRHVETDDSGFSLRQVVALQSEAEK